MVLAGRIERRLFRSVISEAFLVQGQEYFLIMLQSEKAYLPADGHDWLLSLYDPLVKLLGGDTARRILLEQATVRPRHRVLSSANPLLVAGLLYLGLGIAILQANHTLTIISMRVWPACASDRHGSPPSSRSPLS
jgi:hypothetical protein